MAEYNPETGAGRVLSGQQYDPKKNVDLPFTQQDKPYSGDGTRVTGSENAAATDITPKDANQATVRIFDTSAIVTLLSGIYYAWFGYTDIPLPDVLTGITVSFNTAHGDGASSHPSSQAAAVFVGGGSAAMSPRATAQASAAIQPAIQPAITQIWSRDIPAQNFAFYAAGTASLEQILARATQLMVTVGTFSLTTVTISNASPGVVTWTAHGLLVGQTVLLNNVAGALPSPLVATQVYYVKAVLTADTFTLSLTPGGAVINTTTAGTGTQKAVAAVQRLPVFKTQFYTITVFGQQASIAASADTTAQVNSSPDGNSSGASYDWGNGFSKEFGLTTKTERIGPVINATITISGASTSQSISSTVTANTPDFVLNGSTAIGAITNAPAATTASVTGAVTPTSLSATSPADVPRVGYYLVNINSNVDDYGLQFMHVGIVNFALFA